MSLKHDVWKPTTVQRAGRSGAPAPTILLVEDEASLNRLVTRLLTLHGYRVIDADSGRRALSLWKSHRDEIDLLLTDIVLPQGLGGHELGERLQMEKPTLKVIYTSGYDFGSSDGESHRTETNFLPKPYIPEQLIAAVRSALESHLSPESYVEDSTR
jgi:two-component system, cell cycle sensor histidine kinase and response regulator CckA